MWINKPNANDVSVSKVGPKNFFCGRKGKFGLNMQGACDVKGRFLDVTIAHPGAASDYLAFVTSSLHAKLERKGFLAPGLVSCGDNTHVSNEHMVTPCKNISSRSKDACDFYHSQVRICVECAFGMLVHRWAILQSPMPVNIPLRKVTALTYCLCKLHNYCTNENEQKHHEKTKIDAFYTSVNGSVSMETDADGNQLPKEIVNGGEHSDDFLQKRIPIDNIPRERLLQLVIEKDLKRHSPRN